MATFTTEFVSFAQLMNRLDPQGNLAQIAELLTKKNRILEDIPMIEGNMTTGHMVNPRTALPSGTWRRLNEGVAGTSSTTAQFTETCGLYTGYSKIDSDLLKLGNNGAALRASEDAAFMESWGQEIATGFFYHSAIVNPERPHGLAARYSATSGITASAYVTKGTNAGSNCQSVYLLNLQPKRIYGIYPKGTMGGFSQRDLGEQLVIDPNNSNRQFAAHVTKYDWWFGVAVEDYRYGHRHQWDPDDANYADTARGLYLAMQDMTANVYDLESGRARFYMNRVSLKKLQAQLASNDANYLTYLKDANANQDGMLTPHFLGIPIRLTDALVAETAIS